MIFPGSLRDPRKVGKSSDRVVKPMWCSLLFGDIFVGGYTTIIPTDKTQNSLLLIASKEKKSDGATLGVTPGDRIRAIWPTED